MTVLNWEFIQQYLPLYEKAAWLTLRLGVAGIFWAILVGLVCAVLQYEKVPVLRRIVGAYIQLSRNTPLLVQLFFLYYGLPKIGIKTNAELCGIAGLAFLGGSYMAEAFRSGLEAIEPIQTESAYSLGMNRWQTMRYIIMPQAFKVVLPTLCNEFISLLKETSVSGYIAIQDLTKGGDIIRSRTYSAFMPLIAVALVYLTIVLIFTKLIQILERRLRQSER